MRHTDTTSVDLTGGAPLGPADDPSVPPLTRTQLAGLLAAGVVGGALLPGNEPGVGLTVVWLTIASAVLVARPAATWPGPWRRAMAGTAVVAGGLPAHSDAGWVVAPALLVALGAAVLALAGGGGWLGLVRPALRSLPVGLGSFAAVAAPLRDLVPADARRHPGVRATALTVLLLGAFGALFASADRLFDSLVRRFLVPEVDLELFPARAVVTVLVTVGCATLVRLRARGRDDRPLPPPGRHLQGIEWQVPLSALVVLFATFVTLQFGVLFGGHERVLATAGLTYAEYARGGFGQLLVVAALTLMVVAATGRYAARQTVADERLQRRLLATLCVLTLVVLASALHRLGLYPDAYGYTRLRFAAQFALWWFAGVFVLLLATGALRRTRLLPRTVTLLTVLAVVGVGYAHPDARIATWNVQRHAAEGRIDVHYLADLSADAVPALLTLPDDVRGCVLGRLSAELGADGSRPWAEWRWSRGRAVHLLDEHGPLPRCADMDGPGRPRDR